MASDDMAAGQTATLPATAASLDYAFLRQQGMRWLERLAANSDWTDFNAHDPGITILEQLCYALSDWAYRIDYDLPTCSAATARTPMPVCSAPTLS